VLAFGGLNVEISMLTYGFQQTGSKELLEWLYQGFGLQDPELKKVLWRLVPA
jgi:hypothetical protein